jgi:hypothetical protein
LNRRAQATVLRLADRQVKRVCVAARVIQHVDGVIGSDDDLRAIALAN